MVKVNLLGRCLLADHQEFLCRVEFVSFAEGIVTSGRSVPIGEPVTLCVDQLGIVHGRVKELHEQGFSLETASTAQHWLKASHGYRPSTNPVCFPNGEASHALI